MNAFFSMGRWGFAVFAAYLLFIAGLSMLLVKGEVRFTHMLQSGITVTRSTPERCLSDTYGMDPISRHGCYLPAPAAAPRAPAVTEI